MQTRQLHSRTSNHNPVQRLHQECACLHSILQWRILLHHTSARLLQSTEGVLVSGLRESLSSNNSESWERTLVTADLSSRPAVCECSTHQNSDTDWTGGSSIEQKTHPLASCTSSVFVISGNERLLFHGRAANATGVSLLSERAFPTPCSHPEQNQNRVQSQLSRSRSRSRDGTALPSQAPPRTRQPCDQQDRAVLSLLYGTDCSPRPFVTRRSESLLNADVTPC